ncbi:hypothetical protein AAHN97_14940 [Chitinophaga niabensis]|uniref:carboxylesterase family protein n=1 Tax=Chitinophaga niabensis TaxID=536979 RepID=UPI0031BABD0B
MKKLLLILLFLPILVSAQFGGNLQAYQVKIASYGATQNALLSLPDDYTSTSQNYPLIIFLHGYGEVGSTVQDLSRLIKQGLPKVISSGQKVEAVHPVSGQRTKFIVLAPQHHGWTTTPEAIEYMLTDLPKKFRIDTNRIYLTGLSAGGQGVIQAVTFKESLTKKIAAIVPMSPSAPSDDYMKNFRFFSGGYPAAWFFTGDNDQVTPPANARRYSDSINRYNQGGGTVTIYSGGHDGWANIYDSSYRVNGRNWLEWLLMHPHPGGPPVIDPKPVPKYTTILHDKSRINKIIVLDLDGKVTLYDSTSVESEGIKLEFK